MAHKCCLLLSVEGHAIGALLGSGICFVSADHDLIQRAVVLAAAMVFALVYGTLDATICATLMVHNFLLPNSVFHTSDNLF